MNEMSRRNKLKAIFLSFFLFFLKFRCMPVGVRTSCSHHNWIRNGGKTVVGSGSSERLCR